MRVALFGGSFDPVQHGHVAIAQVAAEEMALDTVLFAPVGNQPLKPEGASAPFRDRLQMTGLACRLDPRFEVSDVDGPRVDGRPNYTVDTLAALKEQRPGAELFLLTGADSLLEVRRWHEPDRVLEMAEWIAVSRPGFDLADLERLGLSLAQRRRVHLIESVHEEVSSTELRRKMADGQSCGELLPEGVAEYIAAHGLYRRRRPIVTQLA